MKKYNFWLDAIKTSDMSIEQKIRKDMEIEGKIIAVFFGIVIIALIISIIVIY